MKKLWTVIVGSFQGWLKDNASLFAAALSYYTFFSMAPLLLIAVSVAGLVFGQEAAQGAVVEQLSGLLGQEGARTVQDMLAHTSKGSSGTIGTTVGIVLLLVGASAVFLQLQSALNIIWEVPEEKKESGGIIGFLVKRLLSFGLVISTGFLLMVSLLVSSALTVLANYMSGLLPGAEILWFILNNLVSLGVITIFFALIYKYLPDTDIEWGDIWVGAFVTAVLFVIGKFLIGLYLGSQAFGSAYGAAASIVVILLWIFYASQILLLGAEFTKYYANSYGSKREFASGAARK